MKVPLIALSIVLCAYQVGVASDGDKLPPAASAALKEYEASVEKAKIAAIAKLKPALQAETRKGNLDTANLIQAKINELSMDRNAVVGKWATSSGRSFEIFNDGTASHQNGAKGQWKLDDSSLVVQWNNGITDTLGFPPKNKVMKGVNSMGTKYEVFQQGDER